MSFFNRQRRTSLCHRLLSESGLCGVLGPVTCSLSSCLQTSSAAFASQVQETKLRTFSDPTQQQQNPPSEQRTDDGSVYLKYSNVIKDSREEQLVKQISRTYYDDAEASFGRLDSEFTSRRSRKVSFIHSSANMCPLLHQCYLEFLFMRVHRSNNPNNESICEYCQRCEWMTHH